MITHTHAYNGSAALAVGTAILAQAGVAVWLPLLITIVNGLFALLQNRQAAKAKAAAELPPQPLPPPVMTPAQRKELVGSDIEPTE